MLAGFNNFHPITSRSLKIAKQRVLVAVSVFFLMFLAIIVRLADVMVFHRADKNQDQNFAIPQIIERADIVDRNGAIIATSLPTVSLYACPHEILNIKEAVEKISSIFKEIDPKTLEEKIKSAKKFLWIKRNLSPTQEQAVLNQGLPGFHFLKTEKRVYPDQNLLSHVIGGTDIDNIGIAGLEKVFDDPLRASETPIELSIDVKVQYAVHEELQQAIEEFSAQGGAAIVMDIATGEIISMVSLPDFDPNKSSNPSDRNHFNMATSSAIEPGSSLKIINTAFALEIGKISPFAQFDARKPLKIGRFAIHDYKPKATFLSVEEILKYSSNIGSAQIVLSIGADKQKQFFKKLGFLDTIKCELIESQHPLFPRQWTEASAMTISFGHGIAFNPLQLTTVFCGLLNDGVLMLPTLLKRKVAYPGARRIVSSKTSDLIKILLRINVIDGTNKLADVAGYCVGGKSGTAEKQQGGKYLKHSNYCGFIGAFPMTNPKYAVYVVLDDPKATPKTYGYATAGWNANPTAAKIIRRIGPMLGIVAVDDKNIDWQEKLKRRYETNEKTGAAAEL